MNDTQIIRFPRKDTSTYSVDELVEMSDDDFGSIVTENLRATMRYKSPFQQDAVVRRTLLTLIEKLHATDAHVARLAEDPAVSNERYESALSFRKHLIAAIEVTERRASFLIPRTSREASAWKELLHRVCDELDGDEEFDDILDDRDFCIPFADGMTLRIWREIRVAKDPSRVPVKEAVAA